MRRVHLIGGPGSGKSTLARRLAQQLRAPVLDLDEIAYTGGAGAKRPLAARIADVAAIVAGPAWIAEGIYLWWIDDLLRAADTILWLDVPWRTAAWRICLRHVRTSVAGSNRHAGLTRLARFLRHTRRYSPIRRRPNPTPPTTMAPSRAPTPPKPWRGTAPSSSTAPRQATWQRSST